jgi:predicted kinase
VATAHLIHGFLGVGKTKFARELETRFAAVRFSHDEWMVRLYGADPPAEVFAMYFARVSGLIDGLWPRCLELGVDVILDLNFWTRAHRDDARRLAKAAGADCRLYRLQVPDEVALERVTRRNGQADALQITPETFALLRKRFELLGPDEPAIEVG